jgi:hypothetical protein
LIAPPPGFIARAGPAPANRIVGSERSSANHSLDRMAQLGKARGANATGDEVFRHRSVSGFDVGLP